MVIVALLTLIVLILLFGAGVVKGWLRNAATLGCGGILISIVLVWLASLFGEDGLLYVLLVLGGAFLLLGAFVHGEPVISAARQRAKSRAARRLREERDPTPAAASRPALPTAAKPVWDRYAHEIQYRFSVGEQIRAHELYKADQAHELEQYCIATIAKADRRARVRK